MTGEMISESRFSESKPNSFFLAAVAKEIQELSLICKAAHRSADCSQNMSGIDLIISPLLLF